MEFLGRLAQRPLRELPRRPGQQRPRRAHAQTDRAGKARLIQHLYRNNKKRAVQRVLEEQQPVCETPLTLVHEHFARMAAPRDGEPDRPPVLDQGEADAASNSRLCAAFTRGEVSRRLQSRSNTAPGPDGISYSDLLKADRTAQVLTALFNAVLRTEYFPSAWKESTTILLHKKGDVHQMNNWRPISLGDTCPKLFAALLADRVVRGE